MTVAVRPGSSWRSSPLRRESTSLGRRTVERVGAEAAAELAHDRGGVEAAPDHVADRHAEATVRERERVVPVAAEALGRRRQIPPCERDGRQLGQPRHQAALKRVRQAALALGQAARDGKRGAIGGPLQQLHVLVVEGALGERAHVPDADDRCPRRSAARRAATRVPSRAGSGYRCPLWRRSGSAPGAAWPRRGRRSRVPTGIRIPRSTSSSSPFAARGTSVVSSSSSRRIARGVGPEDPDDPREQLVEQALER